MIAWHGRRTSWAWWHEKDRLLRPARARHDRRAGGGFLPGPHDPRRPPAVAHAVATAARKSDARDRGTDRWGKPRKRRHRPPRDGSHPSICRLRAEPPLQGLLAGCQLPGLFDASGRSGTTGERTALRRRRIWGLGRCRLLSEEGPSGFLARASAVPER